MKKERYKIKLIIILSIEYNITLGDMKQMKILDGSMQDRKNNEDTIIKNSSFHIKLRYKQNHSLQGSIQWLEEKKTIYFRSMMELILLLQEAVSDRKEFRSWNGTNGIIQELQQIQQSTGSGSRSG